MICKDMEGEPPERLLTIRQQLESVTSKDFWEIIDRGRNFEFMPVEQRECMKTFFSWLSIDAAVVEKSVGAVAPAIDRVGPQFGFCAGDQTSESRLESSDSQGNWHHRLRR